MINISIERDRAILARVWMSICVGGSHNRMPPAEITCADATVKPHYAEEPHHRQLAFVSSSRTRSNQTGNNRIACSLASFLRPRCQVSQRQSQTIIHVACCLDCCRLLAHRSGRRSAGVTDGRRKKRAYTLMAAFGMSNIFSLCSAVMSSNPLCRNATQSEIQEANQIPLPPGRRSLWTRERIPHERHQRERQRNPLHSQRQCRRHHLHHADRRGVLA